MKKNMLFQIAVLLGCMALVAGIYTFAAIPGVRAEEQEKYENALLAERSAYIGVLTYMGNTPISEESIITETLREYFVITDMPIHCVTINALNSFEDILGLQLKYAICPGQQVSRDLLQEPDFSQEGNERLKEFKVSGLVAGHALPGNYVDVIVSYADGNYDVVVSKIQIYDILAGEPDEDGMYTILLAVNEEQYSDILAASQLGEVDLRIYLSSTQTPSDKTFRSSW